MSRKGPTKIRNLEPDPIYHSLIVARLINTAMRNGKKEPIRMQVYRALDLLQKEVPAGGELLTILEQALDNIKPRVEVRPRRIGGAVYQVPTPVRGHRQNSLALRWLIDASRAKANKQFHTFALKLSSELTLALKNEGTAVAKRAEVERMAEANKAFAHLRW